MDNAFATLAAAAAVGLALAGLVVAVLWLALRRQRPESATVLVRTIGRALLVLGPLLAIRSAFPLAWDSPGPAVDVARRALVLALISAVGWSLVGLLNFADSFVSEQFPTDVSDNLLARKVQTRIQVLRRLGVVGTIGICGAAALMTFPGMRALGAGLLASAGIVGIIIGIAARPTVEAFMAGVQLAWTQPVRLDDVVVIQGEWGRVEEIEATYIVVRLWDLRRLIVPLHVLLTEPFQNWTRRDAALLGALTVEVDYRTPVATVRAAVGSILSECQEFDGEFWNLQVVEAGPLTMRLRVLVSAPNADVAWALRCEVREKLVAYLQASHPECLPRFRTEQKPPATDAADASPTGAGTIVGR